MLVWPRARKKILVGFMTLIQGRERVLGQLVVVPEVAEGRGALGEAAEI
jgi:hypothetical protein